MNDFVNFGDGHMLAPGVRNGIGSFLLSFSPNSGSNILVTINQK